MAPYLKRKSTLNKLFSYSSIQLCYIFFLHTNRYFGKRPQWDCRGASNLNELHQLLSDIMIRRLKAEVLTQLPPKIRQRIPFDLPSAAAKVRTHVWLKVLPEIILNYNMKDCTYFIFHRRKKFTVLKQL